MAKNIVYIGLGSNIEQPRLQIKNAIRALDNLPETQVMADSGYFTSKPMGPEDQPDYVNAVVKMETALAADDLLKSCQLIEKQLGRIKQRHWGERTIDLDILLYADLQVDSSDLTLPHPGICQRDFVYKPLLKINDQIEIPGIGQLKQVLRQHENKLPGQSNSDFSCQYAGMINR